MENLESDGNELPQSLQELNTRIKRGKGAKKKLWEEMASRLTAKCGLVFSPAKVARKWQTLVDGYKGVKDNNNSTGRGVVRFKFFDQMDSLLGGQHDIEFPVVGDNEGGLNVCRPEVLGAGGTGTAIKRIGCFSRELCRYQQSRGYTDTKHT